MQGTYPSLHITAANELTIDLGGRGRFAVHPLWLRERTRQPDSFDARTGQRLYDPADLDLNLTLTALEEAEPGRYRVRFSDGHATEFLAIEILAAVEFAAGEHDLPPPRLWDARLEQPPRARWSARASEAERLAWLTQFLELGFVILEDVPTEPAAVLRVAASFGFTRVTNFGALFDVRSTPEASDLAYTALALDPHTDNPYRCPVPGVQLLHCLANQTRGGLSTLVDGFAVAAELRSTDPAAFALLTRAAVRFHYQDSTTELSASAPPIELAVDGELQAVHFSPRLDFVPLAPAAELAAYYRARRTFDRLLRSQRFELRFRLAPGELMMMDNRRLLHGRTAFDPREGLRHLQGCYIDIDGPRSLYRVLRRKLAAEAAAPSARLPAGAPA